MTTVDHPPGTGDPLDLARTTITIWDMVFWKRSPEDMHYFRQKIVNLRHKKWRIGSDLIRLGNLLPSQVILSSSSNFKEVHSRTPYSQPGTGDGHCFGKVDLNQLRHFKVKSGWGTKNSKNGVLTFSNVCITSKTKMRKKAQGNAVLIQQTKCSPTRKNS